MTGSSQLGGAEKQFIKLFDVLRSFYDIKICVLGGSGFLSNRFSEKFDSEYISKGSLFSDIQVIRQAISKENPTVVITWLYRADLLAGLISRIYGVERVIGSARNTNWPNSSAFKRILLALAGKFLLDSVVANSKKAEDFHIGIGYPKDKFEIIQNFIDVPLIRNYVNESELRLGIASRAVIGKGHFLALSAASLLHKKGVDVSVHFIGPGIPEWTELQLHSESFAGLKVELLPAQEDLNNWFESIDIYLAISSSWESDSNSLLEAILAEKLFVCSEVQAIQDLHLDYFMLEEYSAEFLARRIEDIYFSNLGRSKVEICSIKAELINQRNVEHLRNRWLKVIERIN